MSEAKLSTPGTTRRLAELIVGTRLNDPSGAARAEARRTLLNYVGCAAGGGAHEMIDRMLRSLPAVTGSGSVPLFGRPERTSALVAAIVNGTASNVYGFDDTHLETVIHPSGQVAAALFALAEVRSAAGSPVSGLAFLEALIVGIEAECRLGLAAGLDPYQAGWHVTSVCGVFGAAAATGRMIGLDAGQMTHALGITASQPIGMRQAFGSMTVSLHVGLAAQAGLTAALLAAEGFTASEEALEGRTGWVRLVAPGFDDERLLAPFGPTWEVSANTYKPFASGIVTHPAMEAAMQLSIDHDLSPEQIVQVHVEAHPLVAELTGTLTPKDALESKVSIGHAVAVALALRRGGPREFEDTAVHDPVLAALRGRVMLTTNPNRGRAEANVIVLTTDGRRLERHVPEALGSRGRPMSDVDLERKVRELSTSALGDSRVTRLIALCAGVETLEDVAEIGTHASTETMR